MESRADYHRWSGWPGAYCMLCGIDDPMEEASINWWNITIKDGKEIIEWDTEEHRLEVERIQGFCKGNPDKLDPYTIKPEL